MKTEQIVLCERNVTLITVNTLVVGAGASGFAAAYRLAKNGLHNDVVLICENRLNSTSRNTGSDKQTYYKLGLCGATPDSPQKMAQSLFAGGCVDGDHALVEAASSVECFFTLRELGVAFPQNRYGEYVGYRTDHDTALRATSVGPLTSKFMTQALEKACDKLNVAVVEKLLAVKVIKNKNEVCGLIAYDFSKNEFVVFRCRNVVLATGGPACIYSNTVYPNGHMGMSSLAYEAGAMGKNLTEWQYGLASLSPKWNVSGTYMQVLPRFVSVDENGNEHEFLTEAFSSHKELLSKVFKKGYEWPFDSDKTNNGSSIIDMLVLKETSEKGRKVYLDFTSNPCGLEEITEDILDIEAANYLRNADALFGTPIDRLLHMNTPAYELYLSKGVDLKKEYLQIDLCAQHCNGGIDVDLWWQTCIEGLFVIGEAAGTHGIKRPGGSALNAGQVGALRASRYILHKRAEACEVTHDFMSIAQSMLNDEINFTSSTDKDTVSDIPVKMSKYAGPVRYTENFDEMIAEIKAQLSCVAQMSSCAYDAYRKKDMLITSLIHLSALKDYVLNGGKSRGGSIFVNIDATLTDGEKFCDTVQLLAYSTNGIQTSWRKVRPIDEDSGFFENVWRNYRENGNVY